MKKRNRLEIFDTDEGFVATYTGIDADGIRIENEEAHDLEGASVNELAQHAATIWGLDLDIVDVSVYDIKRS
ncbi:MAG: hypothetical protein U9R12_04380 [Candidatus Caldatribacteriota bacterium]|nr:hypothetical protein [Candidatus Caldatribacteriota bacterium]